MDPRAKDLLERQDAWQRSRAAMSWEEKLRLAVILREALRELRNGVRRH
jgi:hypothetical protein